MLIFWICSFCHKICPCIKSSLNSLFPAKDWQILSWTPCLSGLRSSYTSYPGGDGKGQFLIIQFFACSPAALGQVKTICHISWQTAQEIFPMAGNHQNGLVSLAVCCASSAKMGGWALKATRMGYILVTTPFPQTPFPQPLPFLLLVDWIFPFTYRKRGKEISLQIHSYAGGVENSSFPTGANPLSARWPQLPHALYAQKVSQNWGQD